MASYEPPRLGIGLLDIRRCNEMYPCQSMVQRNKIVSSREQLYQLGQGLTRAVCGRHVVRVHNSKAFQEGSSRLVKAHRIDENLHHTRLHADLDPLASIRRREMRRGVALRVEVVKL